MISKSANTILRPATLVVALLVPQVHAYDDDVDYGAPYLTLENGELVTKDPEEEHRKALADAQANAAAESGAAVPIAAADASPRTAYLAGGAALLALLGVLAFRWSRKRAGGVGGD